MSERKLTKVIQELRELTGGVGGGGGGSSGGGLIGKSGGGDFTTAYASATTITLGAAPYTHTWIDGDIGAIIQITTAGIVSNVYSRDDVAMSITASVLTVTGATFVATDSFVILTNVSRVEIDAANTARTTGTRVETVQHIGANGNPLPSGTTADPIFVSTTGTIGDGRQVVPTPGTAVALAASTPIKVVTISAETNNTNPVTVGSSTVVGAEATRRGTPLYAGDSVTVEASNLDEVFIDAITATEGVTYTYLT